MDGGLLSWGGGVNSHWNGNLLFLKSDALDISDPSAIAFFEVRDEGKILH